jgi:hypothetical protein
LINTQKYCNQHAGKSSNKKQREQNKKGEIIPLVDRQSQDYAEKKKCI